QSLRRDGPLRPSADVRGLLCSGIYWGPSVRLAPDERYQTEMPTGGTLSNHLIEQGEPAPPRNHMTSAAPMSTRARILIGLFVVVLVCVAYLWFFGFQTLIALEARYLTRKAPIVRVAPAQLTDFSISRSPVRKLSYFGYEFEVPWNDVDEAKRSEERRVGKECRDECWWRW